MSVITDVLLITSLVEESFNGKYAEPMYKPHVDAINTALVARYGDNAALNEVSHYGGGQSAMQADVWLGAIKNLDYQWFVGLVKGFDWKLPEDVQFLLKREHDNTFEFISLVPEPTATKWTMQELRNAVDALNHVPYDAVVTPFFRREIAVSYPEPDPDDVIPPQLKLYLVKHPTNRQDSWGRFLGIVVAAEDETSARLIKPYVAGYEDNPDDWIQDPGQLVVTYLGLAAENITKGQILADNAGS